MFLIIQSVFKNPPVVQSTSHPVPGLVEFVLSKLTIAELGFEAVGGGEVFKRTGREHGRGIKNEWDKQDVEVFRLSEIQTGGWDSEDQPQLEQWNSWSGTMPHRFPKECNDRSECNCNVGSSFTEFTKHKTKTPTNKFNVKLDVCRLLLPILPILHDLDQCEVCRKSMDSVAQFSPNFIIWAYNGRSVGEATGTFNTHCVTAF